MELRASESVSIESSTGFEQILLKCAKPKRGFSQAPPSTRTCAALFSAVVRAKQQLSPSQVLGATSSCVWPSLTSLTIVPTYGYYLLPGDVLVIEQSAWWLADGSARVGASFSFFLYQDYHMLP